MTTVSRIRSFAPILMPFSIIWKLGGLAALCNFGAVGGMVRRNPTQRAKAAGSNPVRHRFDNIAPVTVAMCCYLGVPYMARCAH